jgi:hypothetical protein
MCYECSGAPPARLAIFGEWCPRGLHGFVNDSWSDWLPSPPRASREHDPALEPYASMSREQILDAMLDARGGREWEFFREYFLDRCSPDELDCDRLMALLRAYGELGQDEIRYLRADQLGHDVDSRERGCGGRDLARL